MFEAAVEQNNGPGQEKSVPSPIRRSSKAPMLQQARRMMQPEIREGESCLTFCVVNGFRRAVALKRELVGRSGKRAN